MLKKILIGVVVVVVLFFALAITLALLAGDAKQNVYEIEKSAQAYYEENNNFMGICSSSSYQLIAEKNPEVKCSNDQGEFSFQIVFPNDESGRSIVCKAAGYGIDENNETVWKVACLEFPF